MVLAASGSNSAAGATMKSASQSNTKTSTSNPRGPTGPSSSQPRSSPVGGTPGSVSRSANTSGASRQGGGGSNSGSTTSRIGSAASAQRASAQASGTQGYRGGPPNVAAAKASAALNAGLGRPAPSPGALNTYGNVGVGGAALGSFRTATEPVVRNYLGSPQSLQMQRDGWSDLSRTARANALAREALSRPGVSFPNTRAPDGVFGPRANAGAGYLKDATAMGMITTGMPSGLSGMPKTTVGTYSGYGAFNVPRDPRVAQASMARPSNTTVVPKNNASSPLVSLPDGTFTPSDRFSSFAKTAAPFSDLGIRKPVNPQERVLTVEDVPPLGLSAQGGLGVLGVASPRVSERPLSVPSQSTTEQRDAFYGGGPTPRVDTVPSWQQSTYTGTSQPTPSSSPIEGVMRDEPVNFPVKPYGSGTQKAIDAGVGALPIVGPLNTALGLFGKSAGNIFVDEENKLANMTPEQRERYRSYWSEQRANAIGRGPDNKGQQPFVSPGVPPAPSAPSTPQQGAPTTWESDALAYGYSPDQLKDGQTRALIKQLWDMGFIPKTPTTS